MEHCFHRSSLQRHSTKSMQRKSREEERHCESFAWDQLVHTSLIIDDIDSEVSVSVVLVTQTINQNCHRKTAKIYPLLKRIHAKNHFWAFCLPFLTHVSRKPLRFHLPDRIHVSFWRQRDTP